MELADSANKVPGSPDSSIKRNFFIAVIILLIEEESMDKDIQTIIKTLDKLGLALVGHDHKWTVEERELYERAILLLSPVVG